MAVTVSVRLPSRYAGVWRPAVASEARRRQLGAERLRRESSVTPDRREILTYLPRARKMIVFGEWDCVMDYV